MQMNGSCHHVQITQHFDAATCTLNSIKNNAHHKAFMAQVRQKAAHHIISLPRNINLERTQCLLYNTQNKPCDKSIDLTQNGKNIDKIETDTNSNTWQRHHFHVHTSIPGNRL